MMKEATYNTSADLVRLEAKFAPLKDDPRFEVILKSAKPL